MKRPVLEVAKSALPVGAAIAAVLSVAVAANGPAEAAGRSPSLFVPRMGGPPVMGSRFVHGGGPLLHRGGMVAGNGVALPGPLAPPSNRRWRTGGGGPPMAFHRWRHHHRPGALFAYGYALPYYDDVQPSYTVVVPPIDRRTYQLGGEVDTPSISPPPVAVQRPIIISTGCRVTKKLVHGAWRRVEVCHPSVQKF